MSSSTLSLLFCCLLLSSSSLNVVNGNTDFRRGNVRRFERKDTVRVFIQFNDEDDSSSFKRSVESMANKIHYQFGRINTIVASVTRDQFTELKQDERIANIEFDLDRESSSSFFPHHVMKDDKRRKGESLRKQRRLEILQESLQQIQVTNAHRLTKGKGVKVCIIDSGIQLNHIGFNSSKFTGIVQQDDFALANNNQQNNKDDWMMDDLGHGTHVAGIIAAQPVDESQIMGVSPDVDVFIVRAFGNNNRREGIWSSGIVDAAQHCVDDGGANIINMALAGEGFTSSEERAYNDLIRNRGVLIVAAAGNFGPTANIRYPAGYSGVISVAAVDRFGETTSFSQANEFVDLAAPGQDILSLYPSNDYRVLDGTSMACAHVTGVIALLWSMKPTATVDEIKNSLFQGAMDCGPSGRDDFYGHGIVQAMNAISILLGNDNTTTEMLQLANYTTITIQCQRPTL